MRTGSGKHKYLLTDGGIHLKNIWIDTDPGIDDALALAIAAANRDRLNIVGISYCGGNQTLEIVTKNALRLGSYLGLNDIHVVQGTGEPLVREKCHEDDIHGDNGLGNVRFPETGDGQPLSKVEQDRFENEMTESLNRLAAGYDE